MIELTPPFIYADWRYTSGALKSRTQATVSHRCRNGRTASTARDLRITVSNGHLNVRSGVSRFLTW
jgi:hypothetical protein